MTEVIIVHLPKFRADPDSELTTSWAHQAHVYDHRIEFPELPPSCPSEQPRELLHPELGASPDCAIGAAMGSSGDLCIDTYLPILGGLTCTN